MEVTTVDMEFKAKTTPDNFDSKVTYSQHLVGCLFEDVGGTFVWGSEQKLCIDVGSDEWVLSSWVANGGENDNLRRVYTEALHTMFRLMLAGESDASNTRE